MTLTRHRTFQYVGILLALAMIAAGYWYFAARAGVKTNTSGSQPQGVGDLSAGLVGYWKFDENTGTSAADSSTNGSTGTLTNGPTWTTGQIGSAVNLDGTNDYVTDPGATAVDIRGSLSLATWVKFDTLPSSGQAVTLIYDPVSGNHLYRFRLANVSSNYVLRFAAGGGTDQDSESSALSVATGTWYHLAMSYDAVGDRVNLYFNGSLVGQTVETVTGGYAGGTGTLYFGSLSGSSEFVDGQMDEVRIYDRPLSTDEVSSLYRVTTPTAVDTSLKGYWSFNGEAMNGTSAYDWSGAGNHGTLTDSPAVTDGRVGQALNFDGTNDTVDSDSSNGLAVTTAYTLSAWVNPATVAAGYRTFLNKGSGSNTNFYFEMNGDEWGSGFHDGSSWHTHETTTFNAVTGQWYHVVATYNGSLYRIYVNGVEVLSEAETGTPVTTNDDFNLGSNTNSTTFWQGALDEVRVYNRTLAVGEIKSLYDRGAPDKSNTSAGQTAGTGNLNSGLAGYWKMDENTGTTAADSSTNGNTGTLTNGPTWTTGQIGSAVDFDGTNDYINAGTAATPIVTDKKTVAAWIYIDGTMNNGETYQIVRKYSSGDSNSYFGLLLFHDGIGVRLSSYQGGGGAFIYSTGAVAAGQWVHVAATFDKPNVSFYINGTLDSTGTDTVGGGYPSGSGTMYIGSTNSGTGYFNGKLDEIRVYNRPLSSPEIANLYRLTAPTGVDTGLKGYWSFNGQDTTSTTAYDLSGAGNDGALTNGPAIKWGRLGQALQFDGTNDYVQVGNSASMQASVFTYSAWVNPSGASIRTIKGNDGSGGPQFRLTASGYLEFLKQSVTSIDTSTSSVANGVWSHVALTYDGSGNYIFYINGVPSGSGNSVQTFTFTSSELGIRDGTGGGAEPFSGSMDEVRIYDRVLTAAELKALYEAAAPDKTNSSISTPQGTGRLDSGLAGYWPLDNGSGTTATDVSTNASNGTLGGGPTWTTGRIGSAVTFDGANDEIDLGTIPNLTGATDSPFTFAFWAKTSSGDTDELIGWGAQRRCRPVNIAVLYGIGCTVAGDEYGAGAVYSTSQLNDGQWHHVIYTHDSGRQTLYFDGRLESAGTETFSTGSSNITLATRAFGGYYAGDLDEVRVYNRALSADEAGQLYRLATTTGTDTGLKGYWSFNGQDISGTTAYDRSGAGNNGTLSNGPTAKWGKLGQALLFDGLDDSVDFGSASTVDNIANMTFCAWMRPESIPNAFEASIFAKHEFEFLLTPDGSLAQLNFYRGFSSNYGYWHATSRISFNEWTHVCFTYSSGSVSNDPIFYINGQATGISEDATPTGTANSDAAHSFEMGKYGFNEYFDGQIDEARLYSRILSASEIKALYSSGK